MPLPRLLVLGMPTSQTSWPLRALRDLPLAVADSPRPWLQHTEIINREYPPCDEQPDDGHAGESGTQHAMHRSIVGARGQYIVDDPDARGRPLSSSLVDRVGLD